MSSKIKNENTDFLFDCVLSLKNKEECYLFFEDLCTINEIKDMAQRSVVARLLSQKKVYNEIVEETGASTATISRVNRSLSYGAGGYEILFKRMDEEK